MHRLVLAVSLFLGHLLAVIPAQLLTDFYGDSCPGLESFVEEEVANAVSDDRKLAAKLLRLHFHDCFVQGCDGSILLDGTDNDPSEKDAAINLTVDGYDFVDFLKSEIERTCPETVSCADIVALAAREAVWQSGGPWIPLRTGRRDGFASRDPDGTALPTFVGGVTGLRNTFQDVGLNIVDLVALSGAHTIGSGACLNVQGRIPPFQPDGFLERGYLKNLSRTCIRNGRLQEKKRLPLDPRTPLKFDNQYFKNLLDGRGTFISDSLLSVDRRTRLKVAEFSRNQNAFFRQFVRSFQKMSEIDVLTEDDGEIRFDCRAINEY